LSHIGKTVNLKRRKQIKEQLVIFKDQVTERKKLGAISRWQRLRISFNLQPTPKAYVTADNAIKWPTINDNVLDS
jgi:hypothetical protein